MYSKKPIWDFRVAVKTYKNFRVPRELIFTLRNGKYPAHGTIKMIKHANKKRARRLNYEQVLGFE